MSQTEEDGDAGNSLDLPPFMEDAPITETIKYEKSMKKLTQILAKLKNDEFLTKAKQILKFLQDGLLKSDEDAKEFKRMVDQVWKDPSFVNGVLATINEVPSLIDDFLFCSNAAINDSFTDRIATMEANRCFKYYLNKLTPDAPTATTISLFLSVLIGHWTDQEVLMELDKQMGENRFGDRQKWIDEGKARANDRKGRKVETHELSFTMESSSDVETLEAFRKELISKYGEGHQDIEAIVDQAKRDLVLLLGINQKGLGYDGGEIRVNMTGIDGYYSVIFGRQMYCNYNFFYDNQKCSYTSSYKKKLKKIKTS